MPTSTIFWPAAGSTAIYSGAGFATPTLVNADDGAYATGVGNTAPGTRWGNWGFDALVPAGATIDAISAEYQYKWSSSGSGRTISLRARIGGVIQTNHPTTASPTTDTTVTEDLLGDRSWLRDDLLDGTFEIVMAAQSGSAITVSIDYIKVSVTYTAASSQSISIGHVPSGAAVYGLAFGNINLGHVPSPAAVRGAALSQGGTSAQSLPIGKISGAGAGWGGSDWGGTWGTGDTNVRGVSLGQAATLSIGKIATSVAVRGLSVVQAPPPPEAVPTMGIAIALGNPTISPTYTTVPASGLLHWEVQRGRNFELDRFETGTCVLLMDNRDRRWDPTYTSSPYYPNLLPLRRMRLQATYKGVTEDVFVGFIERINLSQTGPNAGFAEIHLVDGFEVLQNAVMQTPTPTLTLSGAGGSVKLEVVAPLRGESSSFTVAIDDPYKGQHVSAPASVKLDGQTLTFSMRRSQVAADDWDSFLDAREVAAAIQSNATTAAIIRATIIAQGDVSSSPGGQLVSGWPQEKAHVRIGRALDGISWPSADRLLDTSSYDVQAITFQDRNGVVAKQVADDAAASELGLLYVDRSGRVVFKRYQSRTSDSNSTTTQMVLSDKDDGTGSEFYYRALTHEYSRDKIYNDIVVEVASNASGGPGASGTPASGGGGGGGADGTFGMSFGGSSGGVRLIPAGLGPPVQPQALAAKTAYASDTTSQGKFWRRTLQISTGTASTALPGTLAAELLRRYKDQHLRISSVTLSPSGQFDLWPHVFARKIGDRVLVKWTPPGAAQQIQVPSWIESVHISGVPGAQTTVEYGLSPVI